VVEGSFVTLVRTVESHSGTVPVGTNGTVIKVYAGGRAYDVELPWGFARCATVVLGLLASDRERSGEGSVRSSTGNGMPRSPFFLSFSNLADSTSEVSTRPRAIKPVLRRADARHVHTNDLYPPLLRFA
jgi:hypothetical protein